MTTTTPSGTIVPSTGGQDEASARAALEGAGFQVRVLNRVVEDQSQDGIVLQQAPPGGTRAQPGSTVTITVGRLR